MSEFWITSTGQVIGADGESGDYSHESYVIGTVQDDIKEKCHNFFRNTNIDTDGMDWGEFIQALAEVYAENYAKQFPQKTQLIQNILEQDPDKFANAALKEAGVAKQELACANGRMDARIFAMRFWNWKTYRDDHIETWRFTNSDIKTIFKGIEEIATEFDWSDKKLNRKEFYITVFSNGKHFSLTFQQIEKWLQPAASIPPIQNQNPQFNYLTQQAAKQVKDNELSQMHPYYRDKTSPFGDSVVYPFKKFVEMRQNQVD